MRMGLIPETNEATDWPAEAIAERNRLVDRLNLIDKGCFNCGGLPHTTTCAVRDVKALLRRAETAERDCVAARVQEEKLKEELEAGKELIGKLQETAAWHHSRATQYAAQRDAQAKRLEQLNEMLDPSVLEGLRETIRKLKEALLSRCPRHCEGDHEFGACQLTRREVAALMATAITESK
jgi:hypothetical protein